MTDSISEEFGSSLLFLLNNVNVLPDAAVVGELSPSTPPPHPKQQQQLPEQQVSSTISFLAATMFSRPCLLLLEILQRKTEGQYQKAIV